MSQPGRRPCAGDGGSPGCCAVVPAPCSSGFRARRASAPCGSDGGSRASDAEDSRRRGRKDFGQHLKQHLGRPGRGQVRRHIGSTLTTARHRHRGSLPLAPWASIHHNSNGGNTVQVCHHEDAQGQNDFGGDSLPGRHDAGPGPVLAGIGAASQRWWTGRCEAVGDRLPPVGGC
jgi:hypothetical protein